MPSKEYPKEITVKLSKYVIENLEAIKKLKHMTTAQVLRYLINKECGQSKYGFPLKEEQDKT
ncbi:MAG: hypothetical protein CVU91_10470 [Firmicutes bacterium HGW-Firmicutes-16]|nr:MAG: hypothetical protein CVU91_10470 [Firmicutes bacterium HGW-Firmicutes-16]